VVQRIVEAALAEDLTGGDPTTESLVSPGRCARAIIVAKAAGVLCGGPIARAAFAAVDPDISVHLPVPDGAAVSPDMVVMDIDGPAASILTGERTALNFLQHLSGVATITSRYVTEVEGTGAVIVDTRKTVPGLRALQKYAVLTGGARNHRMALGDGILIKDNHIKLLDGDDIPLRDVVSRARANGRHSLRVEVEVESLAELEQALDAGADVIMLDNMDVDTMRKAVEVNEGRAVLEASGGVNLASVRAIAETGVDLISVGALTHSAPALDLSLRIL
jgi:nicotinate-nucleotide pyrophosphorylase (carboxylating)